MTNATSATLVVPPRWLHDNSSALLYISSFLLLLTNYNEVNYSVEIGQAFCDSSAHHRMCSCLL